MRSTKRCQRLTNLFFCEAICTQNRSDWMAACINHLYCIGITLSTSPQKVFCHGLGNIWLYPSGKVGPRKVFNNPRKLFERYRWMEKSFGLSDEIVHTTKSTTTMAHLNSPLFLGQMMTFVCICVTHQLWKHFYGPCCSAPIQNLTNLGLVPFLTIHMHSDFKNFLKCALLGIAPVIFHKVWVGVWFCQYMSNIWVISFLNFFVLLPHP